MPGRRTPAVVLSPEGGALTVPATLNCTSFCYNVGGRIRPVAAVRASTPIRPLPARSGHRTGSLNRSEDATVAGGAHGDKQTTVSSRRTRAWCLGYSVKDVGREGGAA